MYVLVFIFSVNQCTDMFVTGMLMEELVILYLLVTKL